MSAFGGTAASGTLAATRAIAPPRDGALDVDYAWMAARAQDWDDLAARAQDPTPFYSRHVVGTHVRHRIAPAPRFATAWRAGRLVGLWPYRVGWIGPVRGPIAWGSPFVTASSPLLARDALEANGAALLAACRSVGGCWLLPRFPLDDAVGSTLLRLIDRNGWPSTVLDPFARPVLSRRPSFATYEDGLAPSRRKDLRRRRRRMAEAGAATAHAAERGDALDEAIEAFLSLERAGWKGRRGTALASRQDTIAFARALFGCRDGPVRGRADLLRLDGRTVAASLALVSGATAFLLKSAYDEDVARLAPGVLLEEQIIRALHETAFADRLDSATDPGSPLDGLYAERAAIGDVAFATNGRRAPFALATAGERLRRSLRRSLKQAVAKVRDRRSR